MKTTLYSSIMIEGDFDKYKINQDMDDRKFYITSENGYSNHDAGGHKSLCAAIKHVERMIKNEYVDRCIERPKENLSIADKNYL